LENKKNNKELVNMIELITDTILWGDKNDE
jgi:hypothetical protein